MNKPEFVPWPKTPRWENERIIITEKIDGTNGQLLITPEGELHVGSRNRWITPEDDNFGFAKWAYENKERLVSGLGHGRHYGEWWGEGIQRGYGIKGKRFSLFNTFRPRESVPTDIGVNIVPVLYHGENKQLYGKSPMEFYKQALIDGGSLAAPGFMNVEGICIYMSLNRVIYKDIIYK